jgi:hypothetical protein
MRSVASNSRDERVRLDRGQHASPAQRSAGKADVERHQEQVRWHMSKLPGLRHEMHFGVPVRGCSVPKNRTGDRKIGQASDRYRSLIGRESDSLRHL